MTVLLLDGDTRQALAATRALGRRDVRVDVGADHRHTLAAASRYCSRSHADELARKYAASHRRLPFPLIQERIEGQGSAIFVLMERGELRAAFAHRRIRELPPSGGASVLRESVPLEPRMLDAATRIIGALNWSGVAMVEFKLDDRDGIPKLLEINGRFWGSLQLAIDAGVDFPSLLLRLCRGERVEPCLSYRVGVKTRWLLGDLDHLLTLWLERREKLCLPAGYPGRLRALKHFLQREDERTKGEIFRRDDPGPALWEALMDIRGIPAKLGRVVASYRDGELRIHEQECGSRA